ncbi:protein kinase domain-containing protein [Haematococcus lacustris]|uniref:Protein kinase domain-containing protein n=1 Tax=Haematococcus lacustris TaxID=44745 RepID=A0A699YC77_HAELA|nr:protein kinase domain-containing protein [Haematococcus lacustris]
MNLGSDTQFPASGFIGYYFNIQRGAGVRFSSYESINVLPRDVFVVKRVSNFDIVNQTIVPDSLQHPLLPAVQHTGIMDWGVDPFTPTTQATPACTPAELLRGLNFTQAQPYVIQVCNMRLAAAAESTNASQALATGAGGNPSSAQGLNASPPFVSIPAGTAIWWQGHPMRSLAADLAGQASAVVLGAGSQLTIRNLTLVNAGTQMQDPTGVAPPHPLQLFSMLLWAIGNSSADISLVLDLVTIIVPPEELAILKLFARGQRTLLAGVLAVVWLMKRRRSLQTHSSDIFKVLDTLESGKLHPAPSSPAVDSGAATLQLRGSSGALHRPGQLQQSRCGPGTKSWGVSSGLYEESSMGMVSDSFDRPGSEYGEWRPIAPNESEHMLQKVRSEVGAGGKLVISGVLGAGAHAVVYKGEWRGWPVAVKCLLFQEHRIHTKRQALQEAAINTRLAHPNIVNTYTFELRAIGANADGSPTLRGSGATAQKDDSHMSIAEDQAVAGDWKMYIVQEYCDGGHLKRAVDTGALTMDGVTPNMLTVVNTALDIACGVQHIHSKNIIHGDLSPANILLKLDDSRVDCLRAVAKVGDFGLSHMSKDGQSHVSNARQGTPYYTAPEVFTEGHMTKAADVYSFGVILHELYCGQPAWRRRHRAATPAHAAASGVRGDDAINTQGSGLTSQLSTGADDIVRYAMAPDQFRSCPLAFPAECPRWYAQLAAACMASRPEQRPKLFDVVKLLLVQQKQLAKEAASQATAPGRLPLLWSLRAQLN